MNTRLEQNRYFGIYEPVASGAETDATVGVGELKDVTGLTQQAQTAASAQSLIIGRYRYLRRHPSPRCP